MPRMCLMIPALVATLATTAQADDASTQSAYSQVRSAIDTMESFEASLTRDIERLATEGPECSLNRVSVWGRRGHRLRPPVVGMLT